jgi:hypothetical protein
MDSDGLVDKELLIRAAFSGQEKEVYDLFLKFSVNGLMDAGKFHNFCKTTKLLNKTNFTVANSVVVFEKSRNSVSIGKGKNTKTINYSTFRKLLLPDIAAKKEVHLDNLIFKLSRVDAHTPLLLRVPDIVIEDAIEVVEVGDDDESDIASPLKQMSLKSSVHGSNMIPVGSPAENSAAKRIQSCSRMRIASRRVMELKEVIILYMCVHAFLNITLIIALIL